MVTEKGQWGNKCLEESEGNWNVKIHEKEFYESTSLSNGIVQLKKK